MCGIAGAIGPASATTYAAVSRMTAALAARGPDGQGVWQADEMTLGHRRLAIVDVEHGQQPMVAADGHTAVTFNGEIYNYPSLRPDLANQGVQFQTHCDTEILLHLYHRDGVGMVDRLDGMFAFALVDRQAKTLLLARDRFGKKPLYYSTTLGEPIGLRLVFASEVRALLALPGVQPAIDRAAVYEYLIRDYAPNPRSILAGVHVLPPGSWLVVPTDRPIADLRPHRYWQPTLVSDHGPVALRTADVTKRVGTLRGLVTQAVAKRLMADVPIGAFLSGGLDSTVVVHTLVATCGIGDLQTFSIGFRDRSFDESPYARRVADHYQTRHYHREFTADALAGLVERQTDLFDEPFADPSLLPTLLVSQLASEQVKVVLSGDGGDELFAGYDPFRALAAASALDHAPLLRAVFAQAAKLLPFSTRNMALRWKLERFLRGLASPPAERLPRWMGAFTPEEAADLTGTVLDDASQVFALEKAAWQSAGGDNNTVAATLDYFQRFYLTDDILVKVDRASMRHGLEVRCPFLDQHLVAWANGLETNWKYRLGQTKWLFKRAYRGLLPPGIVDRPKKGFGLPLADWINGALRDWFDQVLVIDWPSELEWISRSGRQKILAEHRERRCYRTKELWALVSLAQWVRTTFRHPSAISI